MRRRTKLWIALPAAFAAAILLAGAAGWFWLRTSLPQLDGEIRLPGLKERGEVIYDANGIPHIRAATVDDAYFLLGYVHARDRMFQMDFARRIGSGTLSEVVGERTLSIDRMARTLGTERNAERILSRLPEDARPVRTGCAVEQVLVRRDRGRLRRRLERDSVSARRAPGVRDHRRKQAVRARVSRRERHTPCSAVSARIPKAAQAPSGTA